MVRFTSQRTERETPPLDVRSSRSGSNPGSHCSTALLGPSVLSTPQEPVLRQLGNHAPPAPAPSSAQLSRPGLHPPPPPGPVRELKRAGVGTGTVWSPRRRRSQGRGPARGLQPAPPPERPARPTAPLPSPWRARPSLARRPWAPVGERGPAPPAPRAEAPPAPPPRAGRHFRERFCVSAVAAPGRRLACEAVSFVQSNG